MENRLEEIILYIFFGVLTTVINIISYRLLSYTYGVNYLVSNCIAWIVAVVFAYVTNRKFVFRSPKKVFLVLIKEFVSFVGYRILTGFVDMLFMYVCVDFLHINDLLIKVVANIVVIVLNFIFSKLIIFKEIKE